MAQEIMVKIPADRAILTGDLVVPADSRGVVLFAHGSGSSRLSPRNRYVAAMLNQAGLSTLLFDLLTKKEEAEDLENLALRFDIDLLAKRLLDAREWVSRQKNLASLKVGYFGASTGGGAALVAASVPNSDIGAVVSRGGRPDLAGAALRLVRAPTLLIVGGLDRQVIALNEEALAKLTCRKELAIIPGATHLFEEPGALDQVANVSSQWFVRYLSV